MEDESKPVAYKYELAHGINASGEGTNWHTRLTEHKPNVPLGAIRNLTPLYTRAAPEPSEAEVEAVARPIYDALEGPINNQDYLRQTRQWEWAKTVARTALAALRAKGGAR